MSLQIYKPNAKNTGCACSFRFGVDLKAQEPVVFINAIQQHSWDNNKKIGSFSENNFELNKSFKLFTKYNLELFLELFFTNVSLFLLRSIIIYPSIKLYTLLLYKKSIIPRSIKIPRGAQIPIPLTALRNGSIPKV